VTFTLLPTLSESRLYPSERHLRRIDAHEAADLALLYIVALRVLLAERRSESWARDYARKTSTASSFAKWRPDGTDLSALLDALTAERSPLEGDDAYRSALPIDPGAILRWLRAEAHGTGEDRRTRAFVNRIDQMLRVRNSSMKAIRRMVIDWPDLSRHERELTITRLLQFLRDRAPTGEILPQLNDLARHSGWEIEGACNLEAGEDCGEDESPQSGGHHHRHQPDEKPKGMSFLAGIAAFGAGAAGAAMLKRKRKTESASTGATSSGNVATVVGALGAGFDGDYSRSIYGAPKKPSKKPVVIRRGK
jgi:hypothetical protein